MPTDFQLIGDFARVLTPPPWRVEVVMTDVFNIRVSIGDGARMAAVEGRVKPEQTLGWFHMTPAIDEARAFGTYQLTLQGQQAILSIITKAMHHLVDASLQARLRAAPHGGPAPPVTAEGP